MMRRRSSWAKAALVGEVEMAVKHASTVVVAIVVVDLAVVDLDDFAVVGSVVLLLLPS
jgi:hypothetical protein